MKLQPYHLKSLAKKLNEKLNPRFYGPYRISKVIGKVAYHLNLPLESNVHPVFHVSLLKKAIAPAVKPQPLPPLLTDELELRVEPLAVKAVRNLLGYRLRKCMKEGQMTSIRGSQSSSQNLD